MRRLQHRLLVLEVRRRWRSLVQAFQAKPFRPCHIQHMELSHMGSKLHSHRKERFRKELRLHNRRMEQPRKEQHMLAQVHSSSKRDVPSGVPTNRRHSCGS
jgi:hypothetical protein